MSGHLSQQFKNYLVYTWTKLHTTIDGIFDQKNLQPISQGYRINSTIASEASTALFEGYYNFISILKENPNESVIRNLGKISNYLFDIQDEFKKVCPKFSFYSIANQYDPEISHVDNLENNPGIQIFPNSRVKFGRVVLDLLLFVNDNSNLRNELNNIMNEFNINNCESIRNHEECYLPDSIKPEDICKICLSNSIPENPLISLCRCKGSVKYCHLECIRKWIETKKCKFTLQKSTSFHWKKLKCESCLSDFPIFINYKGTIEPLVSIDFPNKRNYFLLKSGSEDKNQYISIYLCYTDNIEDCFNLGRKIDADIRIGDFSLSVNHAVIKLDNNGLYLYDNGSKFGTYTKVKKGFAIEKERINRFLMDKNLIKLQITDSEEVLNNFKEELKNKPFKSYLSYQAITEGVDIKGEKKVKIIQKKNDVKIGLKQRRRGRGRLEAAPEMEPKCVCKVK